MVNQYDLCLTLKLHQGETNWDQWKIRSSDLRFWIWGGPWMKSVMTIRRQQSEILSSHAHKSNINWWCAVEVSTGSLFSSRENYFKNALLHSQCLFFSLTFNFPCISNVFSFTLSITRKVPAMTIYYVQLPGIILLGWFIYSAIHNSSLPSKYLVLSCFFEIQKCYFQLHLLISR